MAIVGARVALSAYTTLGLGGPAGCLIDVDTDEQIVSAVREADQAGEPVLVLGGGSNLVVSDDGFPGTVIRVDSRGIASGDDSGNSAGSTDTVWVAVAGGEVWDRVVEWSVEEGLAGIECLSGIPGLVGATPIQNVGAYGQDVSETITSVRAFDRQFGEVVWLTGAQCEFGYRTSMLKRVAAGLPTGRFVVLGVTFRLRRPPASGPPLSAPVRYGELAARLGIAPGERVPLAQVRSAVLALRRGKGMVLDPGDPDARSAGSFFTNPLLTAAQFAELKRRAAARCGPDTPVPHFAVSAERAAAGPATYGSAAQRPAPQGTDDPGPARHRPAGYASADDGPAAQGPAAQGPAAQGRDGLGAVEAGAVKVPAAWLIERAGFGKGYPGGGGARISTKHTLALTSPEGGSTASLLALAREIRAGVSAAFGVDLANEPVLVGVTL